MFLDNDLLLADGATSTVTVASTNTIDCLADMMSNPSVNGVVALFSVPTAWTQSGTNTMVIEVQAADTEDFSGASPETLVASGSINVSDLTADYQWKAVVPFTQKRYLRMYKKITGNSGANYITAAAYDMAIVKDADHGNVLA